MWIKFKGPHNRQRELKPGIVSFQQRKIAQPQTGRIKYIYRPVTVVSLQTVLCLLPGVVSPSDQSVVGTCCSQPVSTRPVPPLSPSPYAGIWNQVTISYFLPGGYWYIDQNTSCRLMWKKLTPRIRPWTFNMCLSPINPKWMAIED